MPEVRLHLQMLGGLRVCLNSQPPVELARQHSGALLAYLALHTGHSHQREELADVFWPDDEAEEARNKLRKALHGLRSQLTQIGIDPDAVLITSRSNLQLKPGVVTTDLAVFEETLAAVTQSPDVADRVRRLAHAAALYRGELLSGFYQDCFIAEQNRIAEVHRGLLSELSRAYEQLGDLDKALEIARRAVAQDPLNEESHCDLMRLYAAKGQPSAILRQYQELERALRDELGESPSDTTRQLMESLRDTGRSHVARREPARERARSAASAIAPVTRRPGLAHWIAVIIIAILTPLVIWTVVRMSSQQNLKTASSKKPKSGPLPGHLFWRQRYSPQPGDRGSQPVAIEADRHGYFVLGGFVQTLKNDVDMLVAKYDPYGTRLWEYRYNGDGNDMDRFKAMAVDAVGNIYAVGESMGKTGVGNERLSELDIVTIKLNADGRKAWVARYNGSSNGLDSPEDVAVDSAGNVYVAGRSWQTRTAGHGLIVLKYDAAGKRLWEYRAGDPGNDHRAVNMAVRSSGVYVAGRSAGDNLLLKLGIDGKPQWRKVSPGVAGSTDLAPRVAVDKDEGVFLVTQSPATPTPKGKPRSIIALTRFSTDGAQRWKKELPCLPGDSDYPTDLKPHPRGGVVVGGVRMGAVGDYLVASYSGQGVIRYLQKIYTDPCGVNPRISVDRDANVAMTGATFTGPTGEKGHDHDVLTVLIRPNGQLEWKTTWDGPDHLADTGWAVTTNLGPIYIAVQSVEGGMHEIQILKYSPFAEQSPGRYSR